MNSDTSVKLVGGYTATLKYTYNSTTYTAYLHIYEMQDNQGTTSSTDVLFFLNGAMVAPAVNTLYTFDSITWSTTPTNWYNTTNTRAVPLILYASPTISAYGFLQFNTNGTISWSVNTACTSTRTCTASGYYFF